MKCGLCPHRCLVRPGKRGVCGVRENREGTLYALNYARVSSSAVDPIEKKPLYHFFPGSMVFSLGTVGCSFHCEFCQNWQIARGDIPGTVELPPERIVEVLKTQIKGDCLGVAFTYSEPLMWYEYVLDAVGPVRQAGYKNILVTNGFINEAPLKRLLPRIDALNIDVKGFTDRFYRRTVHGSYQPVLRCAVMAREAGCHVEVTTLLIPGLNDSEDELRQLTDWVAAELGPDTPLHFSRYFPNYRMTLEPTPMSVLERARDLAREKLQYVYLGNVTDIHSNTTFCPSCNQPVLERRGYQVRPVGLSGKNCACCGVELPIIV